MKKKKVNRFAMIVSIEAIAIIIIALIISCGGNASKEAISLTTGDAKENVTEDGASTVTQGPENTEGSNTEGKKESSENLTPTNTLTDHSSDSSSSDHISDDNTSTDGNTDDNSSKDYSGLPQGSDDPTVPQDIYDTITISAAGDVTLGRDLSFGYEKTFDHEFELQNYDYGYFLRNVKDIFESDDLTIVNLETTLTTATKMAEKKYRFKADPSYVEILKQGDVEVVSIANNHTRDYLEKGYEDTLATLEAAEVGYFGYEHKYVTEIRGIKIGLLGYTYWDSSKAKQEEVKEAIQELKEDGTDLVIVMYHWGIERDYTANAVEIDMAHFTIDAGADLVLGAHPHVLQGIEEYKGKYIIYSLGNFCFGGNKNPSDKDSMIVIHKFNFKNGVLESQENEVIPCSISSVSERNNYQPTPLEGEEKERVLEKIKKNSKF